MRISDWSSDVCSSDLRRTAAITPRLHCLPKINRWPPSFSLSGAAPRQGVAGMPYVARDDRGLICEVQERETQSACEQVPLDDPELLAYLSGPSDDGRGGAEISAELEASALEFVRVIEDVLTVLIDKRVFMLTDLPAAAHQNLARSEERRVGEECVSTCRSRGS